MKTFLALVVLSLATSITTQGASPPVSQIYRPKLSPVVTEESGATRLPQRPKLDLIAAEDTGTNVLPPRMILGSVDGSGLNCNPSRPKFAAVEATNPNHTPPRPKLGERGIDHMSRTG